MNAAMRVGAGRFTRESYTVGDSSCAMVVVAAPQSA
jgi:hypothetical protein